MCGGARSSAILFHSHTGGSPGPQFLLVAPLRDSKNNKTEKKTCVSGDFEGTNA